MRQIAEAVAAARNILLSVTNDLEHLERDTRARVEPPVDMGTRDDDAKCWTGAESTTLDAIRNYELPRFVEKLLAQFERHDRGRRAWESLRHQGVDLPDYDWAMAEQQPGARQPGCWPLRRDDAAYPAQHERR
jgi:hypothetical protein